MSEEQFFEDDSLEQFLRESTADFKMFPGRRIWHSIYNELHPGSAWPSVGAAVIILSAILYIGISNNNHINKNFATDISNSQQSSKDAAAGQPKVGNSIKSTSPTSVAIIADKSITDTKNNLQQALNSTFKENTENVAQNNTSTEVQEDFTEANLLQPNQLVTLTDKLFEAKLITVSKRLPHNRIERTIFQPVFSAVNINEVTGIKAINTVIEPIISNHSPLEGKASKVEKPSRQVEKGISQSQNTSNTSNQEKEWMENFAFENKRSIGHFNKFKNNASITYYLTPSMGFRYMMKPDQDMVSSASAGSQQYVLTPNAPTSNKLNQRSALNMEMGLSVKYKATRAFSVKGGAQINFTQYNIEALKLDHPTQTALVVEGNNGGSTLSYRSSIYANTDDSRSNITLQSKTMQFSVPLGIDMKIMGNRKVSWNAAATIQPSLVLDGKVYAVSYDSKNYVEDNSFLRRINLNSGVETYLTYELKNGAQFVAGPQLRYQLLSTYDKQYKVEERLYNIGLKIGIVKKL